MIKIIIKKRKKNYKSCRKVVIVSSTILFVLLILFIFSYFFIGNYLFKFALDATFSAVTNAPESMLEEMPTPNIKDEWFKEIPKTIQEINSGGYTLKAYQILAKDNENKWVITIHGYRGQSTEMTNYAYHFYQEGFNILMPDLKGHGLSEGKYIGMGYSDRLDITRWIDYIVQQNPKAQIVLHGVSMGAATVMMTTGEKLPNNVICAIEDCGYSSVYEQFSHIVTNVLNLPFKSILMTSANVYTKLNLKASIEKMDCVAQLKKSKTPTLFIHGTKDSFVPFSMLEKVYNANDKIEKEMLVIEGAVHAYSATENPGLYFKTVFEFVNKYLKVL